MHKNKSTLAIIPARGGSKGIPQKNIVQLGGKPLIAYSIEVALKSDLIDRVIVSTDDRDIADIAISYGAEVPFLRPSHLSKDSSLIGDAVSFTLKELALRDYHPDYYAILYPTHPFRTVALVNGLIQKLIEGHSPVYTVKKVIHSNLTSFYLTQNNNLIPLLAPGDDKTLNRQHTFFRKYGLFHGESYFSPVKKAYLHVVDDPICLIDIDDLADLYLAEEVIYNGLYRLDISKNDYCNQKAC